jgi:hypothetical protein
MFQRDSIRDAIQMGDDPKWLSDILGGCVCIAKETLDPDTIIDMIRQNRVKSFKFLFPLLHSPDNGWKASCMDAALNHGRYQISDFLLAQPDIEAPNFFRTLTTLWSLYYGYRDFSRELEIMKALATSHPDKIARMAARVHWADFPIDARAEAILQIVDFIQHCRFISPAFAALPGYQPTYVLQRILLYGQNLGDVNLAKIINRLADIGAEVSNEDLEDLERRHPNYLLSHQAYEDALNPKLKEPVDKYSDTKL